MNSPIKFGTDGWRSVIADGFTFHNVRRVAHAACQVLRQVSRSRLILVGYDRRFFSDRFAENAARVALAHGFKVELSNSPISSPSLSFQVHHRKAAAGFMFTASHNPYQFNGFKIKGPHGGSVDEKFTLRVEAALDLSPPLWKPQPVPKTDFISSYISALKKIVKLDALAKLKSPIVFDAMHGPGGDIFEQIVLKKLNVKYLRKERDPLFGGGAPEPIEANLSLLKENVLKNRAALGIAVDGDVDRLGLVDEKGRYLPPHTVMPLLLLYLIEGRKQKGKIIQTVSMGFLPQKIAQHFHLPFEEVSVGFKYVGSKMGEGKTLLGGEESGGYGIGMWLPERDSLLCALLIVEMLAVKKQTLSALVDDLEKRFGVSHFKRVDFHLLETVDKNEWVQNILPHINQSMAGYPIKKVNPLDGIKVVTQDDSWVLMRPSGTEPLIRTYSEGTSQKVVDDLLVEADRLVHLPSAQSIKNAEEKVKSLKKLAAKKLKAKVK